MTYSLTLEPLFALLFSALLNNPGTVVEFQYAVQEDVSFLVESGYFASDNYRLQDGTDTGLETSWFLLNAGFVWWITSKPYQGPFFSVRGEFWYVEAENPLGVTAEGIAVDGNVSAGWSFVFWKGITVVPALTIGIASGPVRSDDGTVEFPESGLAVVPHLRVGYSW